MNLIWLTPHTIRALAAIAICTLSLVQAARADSTPQVKPEDVIIRMEKRNAERQQALRSYVSRRRYEAGNQRLRRAASMLVDMRFAAPDSKSFQVLERSGSGSVQKRVFTPLLETEVSNAGKQAREAAEVSARNYRFTFVEFDPAAGAYVFQAEPRTQNKLLFRGKVWIDGKDFAVQRIEGEPAQRPSFWVRRTRFVHEYGKFGDFWFPTRNRTDVELRFFGRSALAIDYINYEWRGVHDGVSGSHSTPPAPAHAASSGIPPHQAR